MDHAGTHDRRPLRILMFAVVVVVTLVAPALTPGQALARAYYLHGGIRTCDTCHLNGHTEVPPANDACLDCHTDFQVTRPGLLCWTCHSTGQDMSAARTDVACTSTCHLPDGSTSTHAAHPGRPATCTGCHPVTASPTDHARSAHHFVPAPTLAAFAPAAGVPGTTVTLSGTNLRGAVVVSFNGAWAVFSIDSPEQITAIVPADSTSGPVTVISPGGKASSLQDFIVSVTPALTLRVTPAVSSPTRRVTIRGSLSPLSLSGATVTVSVQLRKDGAWKTIRVIPRTTSSTGTFSWAFAPTRKGAYRVRASIVETPANASAQTAWRALRVR